MTLKLMKKLNIDFDTEYSVKVTTFHNTLIKLNMKMSLNDISVTQYSAI